MVMFTWDYQGVNVLITYFDIIAISSTISLLNAWIMICQLPVENVLDAIKLRIVTVTLWRCVKT